MTDYADPTVSAVLQNDKVKPGAVVILLAGLVSLAFCGYFWWQKQNVETQALAVDQTITAEQKQLGALQPVTADLTKYTTAATNLHLTFDNQVRYERVLKLIESRLYKKMKVTAIQITDQKTFDFSGSTPDYTQYAKIYTSLTDTSAQPFFATVKPVSVTKMDKKADDKSPAESAVTFSFHITLTPLAVQGTP